ncbi:MAG TPA: hypothetical protein VHC86_07845 [Opitutaceae bacterium]|nr:hypothetical protein [Opitutaceae bacterium]
MPAQRPVRVLLPRPLFEHLAAQAGREKARVEELIVRAVRADLRRARPRRRRP